MRYCWLLPIAFSTLSLAQSFTVQNSNTTSDLRGLSVVSSSVAWASGTHGTFLRTIDAGMTWVAATVPGAEASDFRDVEAFSADQAYLLAAGPGEQSRIYKTTDGGKTWALQFTNHDPKGFYDCMAFWDPTHGIAVGDPVDGKFELIATGDGATWNPLPDASLPRSLATEGAFAASGTCLSIQDENVWLVTGGSAARVFRSSNRGNTWAAADAPILHDNASSGIFSVSFNGPRHGVIAGGDYQHPERDGSTLAYTEDGGLTWNTSGIHPQVYFSAVALDPANGRRLITAGSTHAGYTDDLGAGHWKAYWEMNLNAVAYSGPEEAFGVGPKGKIVRFKLEP